MMDTFFLGKKRLHKDVCYCKIILYLILYISGPLAPAFIFSKIFAKVKVAVFGQGSQGLRLRKS